MPRIYEMVGRDRNAILDLCGPSIRHAATLTKTAELVVKEGPHVACTGFQELLSAMDNIATADSSASQHFQKHALALICCILFRKMFCNEEAWKSFCTEITTDLVGQIKRTGPAAKGSVVSRTALSPIELVAKWCL